MSKAIDVFKAFLFSTVLLFCALSASAAPGFPVDALLDAPLVAVDTNAQDRILIYDVTNDAVRELRFGAALHRVWDFSPDGCRILFTLSNTAQPARLYSADLDGGNVRELVEYTPQTGETWGVWDASYSPAGDRIAFTMIREHGGEQTHHVGWIPANGGVPEFYSVTGDEHTPRWSPDGSRLVYTAYEERVPGANLYATADPAQTRPDAPTIRESDLWIVNADGSGKFRLTDFPTGSATMPRWSPDGDLVGFVFSPSPNSDQFWMIGAQDGALPTQLSYEWVLALDLNWLPDSTAMLAAARNLQGVAENRLWRIPLVGNADLDAREYAGAFTYHDYPRFSADGRYLAYRSEYKLVLFDHETGEARGIDALGLGNTPPVWSPAGFTGEAACSA